MPRKPIKFDLDFMKKDIFSRFTVKQFDDVTFTITPKMDNEPYNVDNMTGIIYVGVNGEMFKQDTNITVSTNSIVITLDKNMLNKDGRVYAEIELTDSIGTVTSSIFIFDIDKKIGEGATIPGGIDGFVEKYKKLTEEFKKQFQTYTTDLDNRFNTLTSEQQQDSEVIDARKGEISLRKKIDKIDEQFNTIESEISKPVTLNKCDEEMLKAIENKDGETPFNLLSIPRDNSVTVEKIDANLKNTILNSVTFDDTAISKVGYVNLTGIFLINYCFEDCLLENIRVNFLNPCAGEIRVYEKIGDNLTEVKKVEFNTTTLGGLKPTININYKGQNFYVGITKTSGEAYFGNVKTYGMLTYSDKTQTSFALNSCEVFNNFSLPFKITYFKINKNKELVKEIENIKASLNVVENVLTVGKIGCQFSEIQDAINSITDDSENNRYLILVYPGKYSYFHTWVDGIKPIKTQRYISIVGLSKYDCIVDSAFSNTFTSNGILKGLTLINNKTEQDTSGLTSMVDYDTTFGYALHIDMNQNNAGMKILIDDCDLISYKGSTVGMGTWQNDDITFRNCNIIRKDNISTQVNHEAKKMAFYCHNAQWSAPLQNLNLINCNIYSEYDYAMYLHDTMSNAEIPSYLYCNFKNNNIYSKINGFNSIQLKSVTKSPAISGQGIMLTNDSFGNSNSILNKEIGANVNYI